MASESSVSSIDFNLARTNLCFQEGLFLYAGGGAGKIWLSVLLFFISFRCILITCLNLLASSQNCVTNTNFCLNRIFHLWLNLTESMCGMIYLCL